MQIFYLMLSHRKYKCKPFHMDTSLFYHYITSVFQIGTSQFSHSTVFQKGSHSTVFQTGTSQFNHSTVFQKGSHSTVFQTGISQFNHSTVFQMGTSVRSPTWRMRTRLTAPWCVHFLRRRRWRSVSRCTCLCRKRSNWTGRSASGTTAETTSSYSQNRCVWSWWRWLTSPGEWRHGKVCNRRYTHYRLHQVSGDTVKYVTEGIHITDFTRWVGTR